MEIQHGLVHRLDYRQLLLLALLSNVLIPQLQLMEQLGHVPLTLLMVTIVINLVYLDIIYQVVVYHDTVNILGF